jgi:hypothetical protein
MAEQHKQFAEGPFGELHGYTGKTPPEGTKALVEEDGKTLTPAGQEFCQKRGINPPNVEALRVLHDQYHSAALSQAIAAQVRNQELIREKQEQTKKISERLRLDWEAQDKAYKEQATAKK